MKTIFSIVIVLISMQAVTSQSLEIYDGFISNLAVTVFLTTDSSNVSGYYVYKKYGQPIPLEGEVLNGRYSVREYKTKNGRRDMQECAKLLFNKNSQSNGQWISPGKSFPLSLQKRNLHFGWGILSNHMELNYKTPGRGGMNCPISTSIVYPLDNRLLFNNLSSEIFGIRSRYDNIWEYYKQYVLKFYADYLNNLTETSPGGWYLNMYGRVVFLSDSLLSYKTSGYAMSGGAHGQPLENYYVFDLWKFNRITFNNIFRQNSELALAKIISEKDNREHSVESIMKNLDNFYLTDKGIGFVFNPYDIDCYGCGTFEFFINFNEIRDLLK